MWEGGKKVAWAISFGGCVYSGMTSSVRGVGGGRKGGQQGKGDSRERETAGKGPGLWGRKRGGLELGAWASFL